MSRQRRAQTRNSGRSSRFSLSTRRNRSQGPSPQWNSWCPFSQRHGSSRSSHRLLQWRSCLSRWTRRRNGRLLRLEVKGTCVSFTIVYKILNRVKMFSTYGSQLCSGSMRIGGNGCGCGGYGCGGYGGNGFGRPGPWAITKNVINKASLYVNLCVSHRLTGLHFCGLGIDRIRRSIYGGQQQDLFHHHFGSRFCNLYYEIRKTVESVLQLNAKIMRLYRRARNDLVADLEKIQFQ